MRFSLLTQYYPPEIGAPQTRLALLTRRLLDRGHQVTVLTAQPNYPTGKVYPGYSGLLRRKQDGREKIIRTFIYPTQKPGFIPRLANYFSFVGSSALFGSFLLPRSDYLMVESPPLFLGLSGFWLSRLKRTRLVFNVSDLWPESVLRLGLLRRASLLYRISEKLEAFFYRRAWLVSGQSEGILASIKERFPGVPTFLLSNGADAQVFGPERACEKARETIDGKDKFVLVFAGLHGLAQGLGQVLGAAEALRSEPDIHFTLIGDGPEKKNLVAQAREKNLTNVTFLDSRPAHEIPALLASADTLLATMKSVIPGMVPVKLYEGMASGRPVVLVSDPQSDPSRIVKQAGAGLVVAPGDVAALTQAILTLRNQPGLRAELGANGRKIIEAKFDRAKITDNFISFLESKL